MKIIFLKIKCLVALLVSTFGMVGVCYAEHDAQAWALLTATIPLTEQRTFSLYTEVQPRLADDLSDVERILIRPAIVYHSSDKTSFFLGYGYTPTFLDSEYDAVFANEHRVWQQLQHVQDVFDFRIIHRARVEQRFIEGSTGTSNRFRYLLRVSHALSEDGAFGLTGYNELFFTLNSRENGPKSGFDRNRVFVGPYLENGIARYELGYVHEYARSFGASSRMIHAVLISATLNF